MSKKLVIATRNAGKILEFRRILDRISAGAVELVSIDQFPDLVDVEETGTTFEENALLKARYTAKMTGLPSISDDSGLCIDALGGAPGIFSARWAGTHGDDEANVEKVLDELSAVPDEMRGAYFICVAAVFEEVRNQPKIIVVNTAVPRGWRDENNLLIAQYAQRFGAVLIDWNAISTGHPEYFAPDGVHLVPAGVRAYVDAISVHL